MRSADLKPAAGEAATVPGLLGEPSPQLIVALKSPATANALASLNVATWPENGTSSCGTGENDTDPGTSAASATVAVELNTAWAVLLPCLVEIVA